MVEQATENRRVPSSNLGPGTSILYINGNKKALLRECFFLEIEYLQRVLEGQNTHSEGIKGHLAKNNFGNFSGMLVESKRNNLYSPQNYKIPSSFQNYILQN